MRKMLLAGAAVACLMAGSSAQAGFLSGLTQSSPKSSSDQKMVQPFYGSINPFYGSINPFYGSINPFYGTISPFWGDISPFWGTIDPFYGTINPFYGTIDPFWGTIDPFGADTNTFWGTVGPYWKSAGPQWGAINKEWGALQSANATDYSTLQQQMTAFFQQAQDFWGPAVQKYTGKDFASGFANDMMAKYNIDVNDPASLANTDAATRSFFFLNWYDGLMNFTGVDHLDWWMPAINWSPMLAQTAGSEQTAIIGLLDSTTTAESANVDKMVLVGGYRYFVNEHGTAVASLIAAKEDGHGVMGVAPNSVIKSYNPFDATGTANWQDVAEGISKLYNVGAHVVNASLGVPGMVVSDEWVNILSGPILSKRKQDLVLVKAAGNEGVMQTQDVPWLLSLKAPSNLIVVGSVNPNNEISPFSNTPGEACFTVLGICAEQNKLKYRFIVAPGELLLVSDGHGGVTRMSGTSFAAPLVTGAVALLQQRWPWLANYAEETAQIIFRSAKDLGAPGVDPVYGWGELDVQASQSPLDFDNLTVYKPYTYDGKPVYTPWFPNSSASSLKQSVMDPGQLNLWQNQGAFIVAFERIGSTYRDFEIPLSNLLVGKDQRVNGNNAQFQSYLYQRMIDWAHGTNSLAFNSRSIQAASGDWQFNIVTTQSTIDETNRGEGPIHTSFIASNRDAGIELRFGEGNGAHSLMGNDAFAMRSDFDPATGGVNPVLGFASGGMYASGGIAVTDNVKLNIGFSQKSDNHTYIDPTFGPVQSVPFSASRNTASVASLEYTIAHGVTLNASYTSLNENNGLLGSQGSGTFAFANGASTKGTTLGATAALTNGWTLSGSATMAHTVAPMAVQSGLSLTQDGLTSTAFEIAGAKTGVFADFDTIRVSLTQPLHVTSGALNYTSYQVTDRQTGAIGPVTQTWNVSGNREYRMEAVYGLPVMDGRARIEGFGLLNMNPSLYPDTKLSVSVGGQFRINL